MMEAMMAAQTVSELPKYGASSRPSAISIPVMAKPAAKAATKSQKRGDWGASSRPPALPRACLSVSRSGPDACMQRTLSDRRFLPATRGGVPVPGEIVMAFDFQEDLD